MDSDPVTRGEGATRSKRSSRWRRASVLLAGLLVAYVLAAYVVVPLAWETYVRRHPSLDDVPNITHTRTGIPGDPLNVTLIGTEREVKTIMLAAKWRPADPLALRARLEIAFDTAVKRAYDDAPVSSLYLWGRKEDLAFEQLVGSNPRHRHHVRFWRSEEVAPDGRPVWVGAATYDNRVGLSHTTGEITHHIAPDVDAERGKLFRDLEQTGDLFERYVVDGFHKILEGRNGGGDPWYTDGSLFVGVIAVKET